LTQRSGYQPAKPTSSGGDAFSTLLTGPFGDTSNNAKLSIAERAALAEKEKGERLLQQQRSLKQQSSAWAGLDSLEKGSAATLAQSTPSDDDWLFGSAQRSPPTLPTRPVVATRVSEKSDEDVWGIEDFVSAPTKSSPSTERPKNIWDLDALASTAESAATIPSRSNTPGDFDFGDREDRQLDNSSQDEEDILGDLARPVDSIAKFPPQAVIDSSLLSYCVFLSPVVQARSVPDRRSQVRSISPPPHIIGQIVEMGFSPQQARIALASTETGLDVQAALETLLSNGTASSSTPPRQDSPDLDQGPRERYDGRYDDGDNYRERFHRQRSDDSRRTAPSRSHPAREPDSSSQRQEAYQQQADKLIAQASEIGLTVLNRASAFWKGGKEKVQKVYEEHAVTKTANDGPRPALSGRPRWMQDAIERDESAFKHNESRADVDANSSPDEALPQRPSGQHINNGNRHPQERVQTDDLFGSEAPRAYVSPFRRKALSRTPAAFSSASSTPSRVPSPIRIAQRQTVSASPSAIAASTKHKDVGSDMFKVGRYADAEIAYTSAIAQLPESHLLLVPLHNNRALTRLKTGNSSGAIEDCTAVIRIIDPSYHPAREAKVTKDEDGAGVDLGDALVKAWRRRAEAYEAKEKWDLARQDWEAIAGADFAGKLRSSAASSAGRCRKMVTAEDSSEITAAPSVRPPVKAPTRPPPRRGPTPPSEALNRLREANKDAEAEDQARHELKDKVDARINAWKNGKEGNIRALIASLDTVLWPSLGWQSVGMADLIAPNQVKIRYTKAIAKLHPDKVCIMYSYSICDRQLILEKMLAKW